MKMSVLTVKIT